MLHLKSYLCFHPTSKAVNRAFVKSSKQTQRQPDTKTSLQYSFSSSEISYLSVQLLLLSKWPHGMCRHKRQIGPKICLPSFVHDVQRCLINLLFTPSVSFRWPFHLVHVIVWHTGTMWQSSPCELSMNYFIHQAQALVMSLYVLQSTCCWKCERPAQV